MKRIVTREEMQRLEQYTIREHYVSSLILMERAALTVCNCMQRESLPLERPLVVCGTGNNGGDGLAIARILHERGYVPEVVLIGDRTKLTSEASIQLQSVKSYGIVCYDQIPDAAYTVVIDALFGIGLTREITGVYRETIAMMNRIRAAKVAVDIPSGVDADTGVVRGVAFHADITVTFACAKIGMYQYPGTEHCGRILVRDIGIESGRLEAPVIRMYEAGDHVLLERKQHSHKGTYGKVLLIAGSPDMCGAAVLSAEAVMRSGAGMVRVVTTAENREPLLKRLPEAMLMLYDECFMNEESNQRALSDAIAWADVVGIGPGISESETAAGLVEYIIFSADKPLVIDADALNIIAKKQPEICFGDREVVVTPHIREMARLSGKLSESIAGDTVASAREYAAEHQVVCVLKDARTVTANADGNCFYNTAGNSGMATAGSGDVLTGIICGLKAQGMTAFEAAAAGVYIHATAGDKAAERRSEYGMTASDIIMCLTETEAEMTDR